MTRTLSFIGSTPPAAANPLPAELTPLPSSRLELGVISLDLEGEGVDRLERTMAEWTANRLQVLFDSMPAVRELALLKTCQRLELYFLGRGAATVEQLSRTMGSYRGDLSLNDEAVEHLFRVAAGLESLASGEREVAEQVGRARASIRSRHRRPILRSLFGAASTFARSNHRASNAPSVAAVAARAVLEHSGKPFPRILVVGTGGVGRQVAELLALESRLTLVYHRQPPEAAFLRELGARAVGAEQLREELGVTDVLVTAAKVAGRLLGPDDFCRRSAELPLLAIDLGMPRNIDPGVARLANLELINLEGLRRYVPRRPRPEPRRAGLPEAVALALRRLEQERRLDERDAQWREAERVRKEEVGELLHRIGPLPPDARRSLELMTLRIVRRLLDRSSGPSRRIPAESDVPGLGASRQPP